MTGTGGAPGGGARELGRPWATEGDRILVSTPPSPFQNSAMAVLEFEMRSVNSTSSSRPKSAPTQSSNNSWSPMSSPRSAASMPVSSLRLPLIVRTLIVATSFWSARRRNV